MFERFHEMQFNKDDSFSAETPIFPYITGDVLQPESVLKVKKILQQVTAFAKKNVFIKQPLRGAL